MSGCNIGKMSGCKCRKASVWHAVVAVFLQFFAWGLITAPMINILNTTFHSNALLYNGIIMGVKGFLSFLSAPLIGALSDIWGRKLFLLVTAFFTCVPIPFIKVDPTLYFILMAVSGIFCVIFSVAFAYVADVTDEKSRSLGYGLVTAGFAASLIISPALGAGLELYFENEDVVVILATIVALLDVVFIILIVPESLPSSEKLGIKTLTFKQVDPFTSLRGIWSDKTVLVICLVSVLSYLPESGQSTCFFVYLTLVLGFSKMNVAIFICYVGVLSALSQTVLLSTLIKYIGPKKVILLGLSAQLVELVWYGLGTQVWGVWAAGFFIAISSITYAAISAYLSLDTDKDKQGAVQGTLMGVRGLCNGLGPAAFGVMFYLFGINIVAPIETEIPASNQTYNSLVLLNTTWQKTDIHAELEEGIIGTKEDNLLTTSAYVREFPGMPFLLASVCVVFAIISALFVRDIKKGTLKDEDDKDKSAEQGSSYNSQSESESHTKIKIASSVADVKEVVEAENIKSNTRKC